MNRSSTPAPLTDQDGPFRYTYLSIIAVPGLRLPEQIESLEFQSFSGLGAVAILMTDCDRYSVHLDRSAAIGYLMLTAFRGHARFGWLSVRWHQFLVHVLGAAEVFRRRLARETATVRETRRKQQGNPGCYLVYQAQGKLLEPVQLGTARKLGGIGFGFDIIRAMSYRNFHRHAWNTAATALSLALVETNASPDTHFVGDIVYLTGRDQLLVYPKTIELGTLGVTVSSSFRREIIEAANGYIPTMLNDASIETAISLFVESQKKENDNLRSFIAAWSALELLVNRLARIMRPEWQRAVEAQVVPGWDRDLKEVPIEDYRLRDRFFLVACVFDLVAASTDAALFVHANNMRSGFYHRMGVRTNDLPTTDVQALFRKYLKKALARRSPSGG